MKAATAILSAGAKIGRASKQLGKLRKGVGRFGGYASRLGRATKSLRKVMRQVSHRKHILREHAEKFQELRRKGIDGIKRAWETGKKIYKVFKGRANTRNLMQGVEQEVRRYEDMITKDITDIQDWRDYPEKLNNILQKGLDIAHKDLLRTALEAMSVDGSDIDTMFNKLEEQGHWVNEKFWDNMENWIGDQGQQPNFPVGSSAKVSIFPHQTARVSLQTAGEMLGTVIGVVDKVTTENEKFVAKNEGLWDTVRSAFPEGSFMHSMIDPMYITDLEGNSEYKEVQEFRDTIMGMAEEEDEDEDTTINQNIEKQSNVNEAQAAETDAVNTILSAPTIEEGCMEVIEQDQDLRMPGHSDEYQDWHDRYVVEHQGAGPNRSAEMDFVRQHRQQNGRDPPDWFGWMGHTRRQKRAGSRDPGPSNLRKVGKKWRPYKTINACRAREKRRRQEEAEAEATNDEPAENTARESEARSEPQTRGDTRTNVQRTSEDRGDRRSTPTRPKEQAQESQERTGMADSTVPNPV